jgi:hypothetical protein
MGGPATLGILSLIGSILVSTVASQAIGLTLAGLVFAATGGGIGALFAILALPMTLAFFGLPALIWSFLVVVPAYAAGAWFGRRDLAPFAVFAVGAVMLAYLGVMDPEPTGAIPGYDQTAMGFIAASLMTWGLYAYFWLGLRRR